MADKLTRIDIPGAPGRLGILDWGERSPDQMISDIRRYAEQMKADAELILATPDEAFRVTVVKGSAVQHHVKTLQEGKKR